MHYAVHHSTAAELIMERASHKSVNMGLVTWKNAPAGKIVKADVSVAKNYLKNQELDELNEIVTMYLDYAIRQAKRHIPMMMRDWAGKLDAFLQFNEADLLTDAGKLPRKWQDNLRKANLSSTGSFKTACIKVILTVL